MPTPKEIKAISPNNSKFIELINEPMEAEKKLVSLVGAILNSIWQ
jgi:hypothetical protein